MIMFPMGVFMSQVLTKKKYKILNVLNLVMSLS